MTLTDPLHRLLWAQAALVAATLPHLGHLPVWVPALLLLCAAWRLGMTTHGLQPASTWLRALLAVACFGGVLATYGTVNGLLPGSALLVLMMSLKQLETTRRRDLVVLLLIAYFLVFAGFLHRETLVSGVYLLGVVWLATAALLQIGRDGGTLPTSEALGLSGRMLATAVPVMVILFLLFPRLPGPLWGLGTTDSGAITGLSDRMSPGDVTELGMSDELVFRVRFGERTPLPSQLYWRALVLDRFDGRTWTRGAAGLTRLAVANRLEPVDEPVDYEMIIEPHGRHWVFALDVPAGSDDPRVFRAADLRLATTRPVDDRLSLRLTSLLGARADLEAGSDELARYLQLPADANPRSRALAGELSRQGLDDQGVIDALLRRFAEEPFYYTLLPPALGTHPVDEFLFETREGFCEHYASAFAAVARAAGIPTRVVLGYQGGEYNPISGYHLIRQADAHAWNEVWLEGRGWVRVDPVAAVAPARVSLGLHGAMGAREPVPGRALRGRPWLHRSVLAWDAANTWWVETVLGYDIGAQRQLLSQLGLRGSGHAWLTALMAVALALFMIALVLVTGRRLRRRPVDPVLRSWQTLCLQLAAEGLARQPWEAPADYARRIAAARPDIAERMQALTALYLRLRYEPAPDPHDCERFVHEIRRFTTREQRVGL